MILEKTDNEILLRLPVSIDLAELQNILDFIKFKELVVKSKANQKDVDILSEEINHSIWNKFKAKRKQK